ncbi:AMP-binding protein [Sneathiella sp.]|jgi:fatty-acyl-CoA synthase|uniref:AMP-binding protein n=1 Tax=Sneathiella sp. TaxID=1964365 RepID=UPI0039E48E78
MKTIPQLIDKQQKLYGSEIAIHDRGTSYSYDDLHDLSLRFANGLKAQGLGKGDRVGLWLPNIAAYLIAFTACARLGLIVVSINTKFKSFEVSDIVTRSGCKALVLWPDFKGIPFLDILEELPEGALENIETVILYTENDITVDCPPCLRASQIVSFDKITSFPKTPVPPVEAEEGVLIFTTSGTTGKPKFVLHSQFSLTQHAIEVAEHYSYKNEICRLLQAVPLCGTFGLTQALAVLAGGATLFCLPVFDPLEAARLIRDNAVTDMNGSDDMFAMLLDQGTEAVPYPSLKKAGYAAFNPSLTDIVERAEAAGIKLMGLWGMSEVQALIAHQDPNLPAALRKRAGGRLISPSGHIRITDPETGEILPFGENGEIELKLPSQLKAYFLNPDATEQAFTEDGYFKTGDLGYQEEARSFVFLTRMGDVLRLGGYLTDPVEIETCLLDVEAVQQVQVVGVITPKGERAYAFVTSDRQQALDLDDLQAHCRQKLAGYKVPIGVQQLSEFPMTESANGKKIQRSKLREIAQTAIDKGRS